MTKPVIGEEQLMAYADGELDGPEREAVERALEADAALASRVAQMSALRQRLQTGLAPELDDPVPDRLSALLRAPAPVIDLAAARARRDAPARRALSWWQLGGMAASLVVGVLLARVLPGGEAPLFEQTAAGLVAAGAIDEALSNQLAAEASARVAVPLSFVDKSGSYCRAFVLARNAGLACREGQAWVVQSLAEIDAAVAGGAMRPAASALPTVVLSVVDARIDGAALDAAGERAARDRGWRR